MAAKMSERNANYLAHEFLNEHWTPFYSSDVADEMANAKLNFVGSATLAENHLELLGGDDLQAKVKAQPTQRLRQLFQDLAQNQRSAATCSCAAMPSSIAPASSATWKTRCSARCATSRTSTTSPRSRAARSSSTRRPFPALKESLQQGTWSVADLRKEMLARKLTHLDVERTMTLMAATGIAVPCAMSSRPGAGAGETEADQDPARHQPRAGEAHGRQPGAGQPWSRPWPATRSASIPIYAVILSQASPGVEGQGRDSRERLDGRGETAAASASASRPRKRSRWTTAERAGQFFDRFWDDEAPVLHRLGVIELA
jgi:hypothetical protein